MTAADHEAEEKLEAAEARAERAEQERDEARSLGAPAADAIELLLARVGVLEEALREVEKIAGEHEGVSPEAWELISDVTRAALAAAAAPQETA